MPTLTIYIQAALVICGLFICDFAYVRSRNGLFLEPILQFQSSLVFYMRICYMRVYFWSPCLSHITRSTCKLKLAQNHFWSYSDFQHLAQRPSSISADFYFYFLLYKFSRKNLIGSEFRIPESLMGWVNIEISKSFLGLYFIIFVNLSASLTKNYNFPMLCL